MSDIDGMNVGLRWYIAHTYTGYENKVKSNLENVIENRGLEHLISEIKIPTQMVEDPEKPGKQYESKIFPGYVFVKMVMTDESWHALRNITGVTGFVGPGSRPTPLEDFEVENLNLEESKTTVKVVSYNVGDNVIIKEGLFEGYTGSVQSVSEDQKTVTVLVKRGRRDMPVEIEASKIKPDTANN